MVRRHVRTRIGTFAEGIGEHNRYVKSVLGYLHSANARLPGKTKGIRLNVCVYTGDLLQYRQNFAVSKIKGYTRFLVGCCYNLLAFSTNFELGDITFYCIRLDCTCYCGLEGILVKKNLCG